VPLVSLIPNNLKDELKKLSTPQKRAKTSPEMPRLISQGHNGEDSAELREYLDLCDFVMREASQNLNGMLLRGSSQYQEKAMNILTQFNFDYDMAKFSILYPTVLLLPETRHRFLKAIKEDETLLSKIVREAVQDLQGSKQDEIDEVVSELRQALTHRLKPEELKMFQRKFEKMQVKIPDDVEQMLLDAEEFSKQVRKQINSNVQVENRLSLEQLEELQELAQAQCLETPELLKLDQQVVSARDWLAKVERSQGAEISLKDLDKLVRSGKQLPVKFGEPFEGLCERLNKALDLQQRIQETFKSNKTRGAVQVATDQDIGTNNAKAAVHANSNHNVY